MITESKRNEFLSVVDWVFEHYPYDKVGIMFDISVHIILSDEDEEEELEIIFEEYLKEYYPLQVGRKRFSNTDEEYERISNSKEVLRKELEEMGCESSHLDCY